MKELTLPPTNKIRMPLEKKGQLWNKKLQIKMVHTRYCMQVIKLDC